jgi:phenylpropionate dioxygenase-like ring-hydroxylating dioxygenase large terminal subunit
MAQSQYVEQQIKSMVGRAVAHAQAGTTDATDGIYRLPVESYSPRSWEEEMNAIFRRVPLMLGLSAELPQPGCYKAIKVLDVPVLLVRGDDMRVRAFINACSHRGRAVTQTHDEIGQVKGFTCPYHAWRFSTGGALLAVADARKFGELDKEQNGLKELACEERVGFIWVCITRGRTFDIEHYLGDMLHELAGLEADKWFVHGRSQLESANWKITHDGYLESYHIPFLHRHTLFEFWKRESSTSVSLYDRFGPLPCGPHQRMAGNAWGNDPQLMLKMKDVPESQWGDKYFHAVRTLFPHISISADKHGGLVSQMLPIAPDRCITNQIHVNPRDPAQDSPEQLQAMRERIALYAKIVRDEDYSTSFSIQAGLQSGAHTEILFGRNEGGAQNFHRSVAHYVQEYRDEKSKA